ncbi:MAG: hypothetical protein NVSMB25_25030 [Thermoleophilaceae bacterium]
MKRPRRIAVAIHDVEPVTHERCVEMRSWLAERGVERVTLLVIPAADLHPFHYRRPGLLTWLRSRIDAGDEIAQHGLQHRQGRRAGLLRQRVAALQGAGSAEFAGLDAAGTRSALLAGRRVLRDAGIEVGGFVAPAYAYTPALRRELASSFEWWAGLLRISTSGRGRGLTAPAVGLGSSGVLKRAASPHTTCAGAALAGEVLRLDLHPVDFAMPRHLAALERVLEHAGTRTAATYRELVGG